MIRVGIAAALLAACAACGGDDSSRLTPAEYAVELRHVGEMLQQVSNDSAEAFDKVGPSNVESGSAAFAPIEEMARRKADRIAALEPPEGLDDENAALAAALTDYADGLADLRRAFEGGSVPAIEKQLDVIFGGELSRRLSSAQKQLKRRGYPVDGSTVETVPTG